MNNLFFNKEKIFDKYVVSCSLLNVFELDRSISLHLLKRILEIERRIANSIIYNIPLWFLENKSHEYSSEFLIKIENGNILSLDCKEWDILFPNIKNQVNESNYK